MARHSRGRGRFTAGAGGVLLLFVFGLPFFAIGLGMTYMVLGRIFKYREAQAWAEESARILSVDLERHSSDDGYTYEVVCEYEYERHGRRYVADRVGLSGGSDNIGSWQQDTYRRLSAAHNRGEPVTCYVNPSRPDEAMLVRDLRYGVLAFTTAFATIFGSVGLGIGGVGLIGRRWGRRSRKLARAHPDEPWLHNPDWAEGILRPSSLDIWAAITKPLAIYWNAVSLPVAVVAFPALVGPHWGAAALNMLYPLAGAGLIALAVHSARARRRWGRSHLELDTLPGVIGGHLRGTLVIVGDVHGLDRVHVSLKCTKYEGRGDDTRVSVLHEDRRSHDDLGASFGERELRLPVEFQIPGSCAPTGDDKRVRVVWQLSVRGSTPGPDLSLKFDVPVFVTDETDPNLGKSAELRAVDNAVVLDERSPVPDRIRVTRIDAVTRQIEASSRPSVGMFLGFSAVFVLFACADVFMIYQMLTGEWYLICMLLFFVPATLLLPLLLLSMVGKHVVVIGPEGLRVRRSWGAFGRERSTSLERIETVRYKESASAGSKKWYAAHVILRDGRKIKLAGALPGELAARWFVRQVLMAIGREEDGEALSLEMPVAPVEDE